MSLRPSNRVATLERTLIRQIFDNAPADSINLGLGQPDLETPPALSLAGIEGIVSGRTRYTPTAGDPELRQALARHYDPFAQGVDDVLITCGSQEAMFAAFIGLVDPGEEILYPEPGYPAYPTAARLVGARPTAYRLRAENGFRIEAQPIIEMLGEETRLVVLCAPANPSGACHDEGELKILLEALQQRGIAWISDEIYSGFCYLDRYVTPTELAPGTGLLCSGFSKDLCMTGWRIGWLIGPQEILARCTAVHQHLVTCASSVSQRAALAAFSPAGRKSRLDYLDRFRVRRDLMARELSRIPGLNFEPPDGAFYYFVDVSTFGDSLDLARRILDRRQVITIPGEAFGPSGAGYLRVSFAADENSIVEGLRRIRLELESKPQR